MSTISTVEYMYMCTAVLWYFPQDGRHSEVSTCTCNKVETSLASDLWYCMMLLW